MLRVSGFGIRRSRERDCGACGSISGISHEGLVGSE